MKRDERLRDIDARAKRYRKELEGLVRATIDVRASHPMRGFGSVPKGAVVARTHYVVGRRPDAFEPLPTAVIEGRIASWVRRQRAAWNVD